MARIDHLLKMKWILLAIDKNLDALDEVDVYGDAVQNFEDMNRERHTTRLLKMVNSDIKECGK